MATIESITAGKLLLEFLRNYNDEPFGEQALVITKQLLDIAFPEKSQLDKLDLTELESLLAEAEIESKVRKTPFFNSLIKFVQSNPPSTIRNKQPSLLQKELIQLIESDKEFPSFEISRATYDLSGNPESASFARTQLEGALISTTASLFCFLLIEEEGKSGKFFHDLDHNIHVIAKQMHRVTTLIRFLKELNQYSWNYTPIIGCLPSLEELKTKDICKYLEDNFQTYLEKFQEKILNNFQKNYKEHILMMIDSSYEEMTKNRDKLPIDTDEETLPNLQKLKLKTINELQKIEQKLKNGKNISSKEFESIKNSFLKNCEKIERSIEKELSNFNSLVVSKINEEPKWLKYHKKGENWELHSSEEIIKLLDSKLKILNAFSIEKKTKEIKQAISIFEQLGGIHFAMENIIAHDFYERLPSRLQKTIESPAKLVKNKEVKYLQEIRYNEGLEAVQAYLIPYSEKIISNLLTIGLEHIKSFYILESPQISIDEENIRYPKYLDLLDLPRDFLGNKPPETFFESEDFTFRVRESSFNIGFNLNTFVGKGNDLFSLLVSSASFENAEIYKKATKILGKFTGYVYSTALGNMRVCPPSLKAVDDLFL
ncbi:hypothetical protein [Candidatus Hodarchaeum mangrovi]